MNIHQALGAATRMIVEYNIKRINTMDDLLIGLKMVGAIKSEYLMRVATADFESAQNFRVQDVRKKILRRRQIRKILQLGAKRDIVLFSDKGRGTRPKKI